MLKFPPMFRRKHYYFCCTVPGVAQNTQKNMCGIVATMLLPLPQHDGF